MMYYDTKDLLKDKGKRCSIDDRNVVLSKRVSLSYRVALYRNIVSARFDTVVRRTAVRNVSQPCVIAIDIPGE